MKEGRGRGSSGQLMYSQSFGNLYLELASMIGPRDVLFSGDKYHGATINRDLTKDSVLLRPVVSYTVNNFSIAAAMEGNLVKDAVVVDSGNGLVDISNRLGFGLTTKYQANDWNLIANFAYMDAVDETNMTFGVNALFKGFGLGYIHANNDYEKDKIATTVNGNAKVDTVYASYEFADVLEVDDFSIYLGTYYSKQTSDIAHYEEDGDLGARVRFKYFF